MNYPLTSVARRRRKRKSPKPSATQLTRSAGKKILQDDLCVAIQKALLAYPVLALTTHCIAHLTRLCQQVVKRRKRRLKGLVRDAVVLIMGAVMKSFVEKYLDAIRELLWACLRNVR